MSDWKKKPFYLYLGKAGHKDGPCIACSHKECESMYAISDKTCEYCLKPIGLNVVWRYNTYNNGYTHYNCYMEHYISVSYKPDIASVKLAEARKKLKTMMAYAPPPSLPAKNINGDLIKVNFETKSPYEITRTIGNKKIFLGICADAELACKWSRAEQMYNVLGRVAEFFRQRGTTKEEWLLRGEVDALLYSTIMTNVINNGEKNDNKE